MTQATRTYAKTLNFSSTGTVNINRPAGANGDSRIAVFIVTKTATVSCAGWTEDTGGASLPSFTDNTYRLRIFTKTQSGSVSSGADAWTITSGAVGHACVINATGPIQTTAWRESTGFVTSHYGPSVTPTSAGDNTVIAAIGMPNWPRKFSVSTSGLTKQFDAEAETGGPFYVAGLFVGDKYYTSSAATGLVGPVDSADVDTSAATTEREVSATIIIGPDAASPASPPTLTGNAQMDAHYAVSSIACTPSSVTTRTTSTITVADNNGFALDDQLATVSSSAPGVCTVSAINASGQFTITAVTAGSATVNVSYVDPDTGTTRTAAVSVTSTAAPTVLVPAPGTATVGSAYSTPFSAAGGSGAITVTKTSGTLPPGLALGSGVISGTPTTAGTYTFGLTATDSIGAGPQTQASITVVAAVSPTPTPLPAPPTPTPAPAPAPASSTWATVYRDDQTWVQVNRNS